MLPTRNHPESILVVNDDQVQLNIISGILEEEGIHSTLCDSADAALAVMASSDPFDLLITDLHMPGIDGWRFCRLLRSSEYPQYNQIPILVVSATFSGEDACKITADLGANAFLPLPIHKTRFIENVRSLLSGESSPITSTVLIVDDSYSIAHALQETFSANSYRTITAGNANDAIRLFRRHRPETVVVDYHLPDMAGDRLLIAIKQIHPQSVVVIITIDPRPELALDVMKKGAAAYVRKPFDPEYLVRVCENARRERALLHVEEILEARTRELYESESKYRMIYENSPEMMQSITTDGCFCDVNRRWLKEMGYFRDEVIGRPAETLLTPASLEKLRRISPNGFVGKLSIRDLPCQFVRKDGGIMDAILNSQHVKDTGEKHFNLCIIRDVTSQKKAEEERIKMAAQIHKFESLSTMAGSIAHNFNNLLMGIMGNLEMALLSLPTDSPVIRNIEAAQKSSQRASEVSAMMLTFAGKGQFYLKTIELNHLVEGMMGVLEVSASQTADLRFEPEKHAIWFNGDASQIRQVIVNLITNASESMDDTKGTIVLRTGTTYCDSQFFEQPFVDNDLPKGKYVFIEVEDNGCGMPPETRNRIFDPFFTTKFTGRGLGLAAVLGIVRGHQGAVTLHSEPGQGTRIRVLLPAVQMESKAASPAVAAPEKQAMTPKKFSGLVLLVDDEEIVLEVGKRMLEQLGLRVVTASDGFEAIEIYKKRMNEINCVLLDLSMPRMDGEETYHELRKLRKDVRVVLSSGYTEDVVAQRFSELLPFSTVFIQKPYNTETLKQKLSGIL